jgi:hypothetical protein
MRNALRACAMMWGEKYGIKKRTEFSKGESSHKKTVTPRVGIILDI